MPLNVEIKARTHQQDNIRQILLDKGADARGTDHQTDTYFHCSKGRMKLRQGNIEHSLIHYDRPDQAGPKDSQVHLYHPQDGPALKALLTAGLGVWKEVKKAREIYFIDNVKFHLDQVEGLGTFVEIEAIDRDGSLGQPHLLDQCQQYMALFGIAEKDLLEGSYSDMV
ncbi:MAG: class IV adenylate cyclase [Bacteroidota bacterium]